MNNYCFQEVLCPFCNKSYMTSIQDVHNTVVKHDGQTMSGWMDVCPKCGSWVFVVENDLKGKDLSAYPEKEIQEKWYLQ